MSNQYINKDQLKKYFKVGEAPSEGEFHEIGRAHV